LRAEGVGVGPLKPGGGREKKTRGRGKKKKAGGKPSKDPGWRRRPLPKKFEKVFCLSDCWTTYLSKKGGIEKGGNRYGGGEGKGATNRGWKKKNWDKTTGPPAGEKITI